MLIGIMLLIDCEKQIRILSLEQDYELISLYAAMKKNDRDEMDKSKNRLKEIQSELDWYNSMV